MATSGYEHLGLVVGSEQELRAIHGRAQKVAERYPDLELGDIHTEYDGALVTFKLRFRLPLSVEVQYLTRPHRAAPERGQEAGSAEPDAQ
jgi:hypothetical protein